MLRQVLNCFYCDSAEFSVWVTAWKALESQEQAYHMIPYVEQKTVNVRQQAVSENKYNWGKLHPSGLFPGTPVAYQMANAEIQNVL